MAKMDGVIISNELVKPSSPTPPNLRTHRLSFLDGFAPSMLVPIVLYFPHAIETFSEPELTRLKRSLSLTLTRFYPLAGRINSDRKSVHCNDQGVSFAVVRFAGHKLSDLLINPDPNLPSSLLPCTDSNQNQCPNSALVLIQLSYFDGGGVAIGALFSHILADAATIASFLKSWSAAACGSTRPVSPDYTAQSMFPRREEAPKGTTSKETPTEGPNPGLVPRVVRRYMFDSAAISSLKAESGVARPSRVEVLAALFWRCYMAASLANNHSVSLVGQWADVRRRARPKLSPDSFGNLGVLVAATSRNEIGIGAGDLVPKLRDSVRMIDGDLIHKMRGDEGFSAYRKVLGRQMEVPEGGRADVLLITSWCGFGLYSIELGWGKPDWISRCDTVHDSGINEILLMDSRDGEGVEAWVILDGKYMAVFDGDEQLRALAATGPSRLHG